MFLGDENFGVPAVRVMPKGGSPSWLFADDPRHAPIGFVPGTRIGAAALLLDDEDFTVARIHSDEPSAPGWTVNGTLSVQTNGDVTLDAGLELGDAAGYGVAERFRDADANRRKNVGRGLATQLFPGWTIADARLPAIPKGERFRAEIEATRRGAAQRVGDRLVLPLPMPPSEMFKRYGAPSPRTEPLDLRGQTTEEWSLLLTPDEGLAFASIPDDVRIEHPLCDYVLTFQREGAGLRIRRTVRIRPGRVEPGMFADWVHRLQTMDRAEESRIEFDKR